MKIYTKTGDGGETSLYGGSRVSKDSSKVWAYGTVDELNSQLGICYALLEDKDKNKREIIRNIQKNLFTLSSSLASDERGALLLKIKIEEDDILNLEHLIDSFSEKMPKITEFTYPGYNLLSANFHVARTIARRAERYVVSLRENKEEYRIILKYLNRLSDFLYIMAETEAG